MQTYETVLTSWKNIRVRVKAESFLEAHRKMCDFIESDIGCEAIENELADSEHAEWNWGPMDLVVHGGQEELPTIITTDHGLDMAYESVN